MPRLCAHLKFVAPRYVNEGEEAPEAAVEKAEEEQQKARVVFIADWSGRNRSHICTLIPNTKEAMNGEGGAASITVENFSASITVL